MQKNINEEIEKSVNKLTDNLKAKLSMEDYHEAMNMVNDYIDLNMIALDMFYKQAMERHGIDVAAPGDIIEALTEDKS